MQVVFERAYNHTFPSRAVVAYPAGWQGTVKREVGLAAIAAGRARRVRVPRKSVAARPETQ